MTQTNQRERAGENSEQVFEVTFSDTTEHDLPDVDSGDGFSVEKHDETVVKLVNTHDQDVTARLEATNYEDGNFAEPVTVESGVTVGSGGGTALLGDSFNAPVDLYRVVVSASTAPSGNGALKAVFMNGE